MKNHNNKNIDFYPSYGYLILILFYAFFYRVLWTNFNNYLTVFEFNSIFIAIPSLVLLIFHLWYKVSLPAFSLQDGLVVLFLILVLSSYFYAINAPMALKGASYWCSMILVYYNLKTILTNQLEKALVIISFTLSLIGIVFILFYFLDNFSVLSNIVNLNESYSETMKSTKSLIGLKNATASFIFMNWAILFSITAGTKKRMKIQSIFDFLALPFLLILISRNVYLGLIEYGVLYTFFLRNNKLKKSTIISVIGGVLILFFLSITFQSFASSLNENTISVRLKLWSYCYKFITDQPILGIGNYQWDIINSKFKTLAHPHNDFIRIVLELGFIGLMIYSSIYLTQVIKGYRLFKQGHMQQSPAILLLITLVSFISLGIFDSIHYRISHGILLMLVLALIDVLLLSNHISFQLEQKLQKLRYAFKYFIIVIAILLLFYQYHIYQNDKEYKLFINSIESKELYFAEKKIKDINFNLFVDDKKSPAYYKLGILYQKQGEFNKAKHSFNIVLKSFPLNLKTAKALYKISKQEKDKDSEDYYFNLLKKINKNAIKNEIRRKYK